MKKKKKNSLATHLSFAAIFLTLLWMFISDLNILITGNAIILAYVVFAIGSKTIRDNQVRKQPQTKR